MTLRRIRRAIVLSLAFLLPLSGHTQEGNGPCRRDVEQYCRGQQGDPAAAQECLLDHQQEISDACYENLKQRLSNKQMSQEAGGPGGKPCRQDVQTWCKGVQPGGGRIVNCLLDHQKDLSDACYAQLAKRQRRN